MIKKQLGSSSLIGRFIKLLLCLQMSLSSEIVLAQQTQSNQIPSPTPSSSNSNESLISRLNSTLSHLGDRDLAWRGFLQTPLPEGLPDLHFDPGDPAIDKDPFFLRQQSWSRLTSDDDSQQAQSTSISESDLTSAHPTSVDIEIPETRSLFTIHQPLHHLATTERFSFFSLDEKSPVFSEAAGPDHSPGEGLFFIDRSELALKSLSHQPVPIYYLPLPGVGWTGILNAQALPPTDLLAIYSEKNDTSLALSLEDIETIMAAEKMNLAMALFATWADQPIPQEGPLIPAPRTTASFGLFFTGQERLAQSVATTTRRLKINPSESIPFLLQQKLFQSPLWSLFKSSEAQAINLSPDALARVVFMASLITGMLAVSLILKMAHPAIRRKQNEIRAFRRERDQRKKGQAPKVDLLSDRPSTLYPTKKEWIQEVGDVYAHVSTAVHQIPAVSVGHAFRIFIDRFIPSIGAAEHTLIRRFMNTTYFFVQDSIKNTPVTATTLFYGALLYGSFDGASVAAQYFFVTPLLCEWLAKVSPPEWQQQITNTFNGENEKINEIATADTIKNELSNLQTGASTYSRESRQQIIEGVIHDVDAALRKMQKDPHHPSTQSRRIRMIEERTEHLLRQRGAPGRNEFQFDLNSLIEALPGRMGFKAPKNLSKGSNEKFQSSSMDHEGYILEKRAGLTKNVLKRAISKAQRFALGHPTEESHEVVRILEDIYDRLYSRPKLNLWTDPKLTTQRKEEIRAALGELTELSYEGPIQWIHEHLPESWKKRGSPSAVAAAGLFFRQALFSYLDVRGESLLRPSPSDNPEFGDQARKHVLKKMKSEDRVLRNHSFTEAESQIIKKKRLELDARTELEVIEMAHSAKEKKAQQNFKPQKEGFYARIQLKKIAQRASSKLTQSLMTWMSENESLSKEEHLQLKKSNYTEAMAQELGLHFLSKKSLAALTPEDVGDYKKMLTEIETTASNLTESELRENGDLNHYLKTISPVEAVQYEVQLYAHNYIRTYVLETSHFHRLSPLHPAQPGRFQKWRQVPWVQHNRFVTRFLRAGEAFFNDQSFELGLKSTLERSSPLFSDLWTTHRRMLKKAIPTMTFSYLWYYYCMNIDLPYGTALLYLLTGAATVDVPSQWLYRVARLNDFKPWANWKNAILFSIPDIWLSFLGQIPVLLFSDKMNEVLVEHLGQPLEKFFQGFNAEFVTPLIGLGFLMAIALKALRASSWNKQSQQFHRDFQKTMAEREKIEKDHTSTPILNQNVFMNVIAEEPNHSPSLIKCSRRLRQRL